VTKVIYRADEFGRVKIEQYAQTRLPDGHITLDYSEHYETPTERASRLDVADAHPELSAAESQRLHVTVTSSDEDEDEDEDEMDEHSEDGDSETNAKEEETLTEEEKKGSLCCLHKLVFWVILILTIILFVLILQFLFRAHKIFCK